MNRRDRRLDGLYALTRANPELVDQDYLAALSDDELQFLAQFIDETVYGHFPKGRPAINKGERRQECYNARHARRRDVWTKFDRVHGDIHEMTRDTDDDGEDEE